MNGQIPQSNVAHLISQMTNPMERFGAWADRFGEQVRTKERQEMLDKERADEREHQRMQEALANKRADEQLSMQKEQFGMQKKQFETAENTLRATTQGATTLDSAAIGNALLDKQASLLATPLDAKIAGMAKQSGMTKEQFEQSDLMRQAAESGAFDTLTSSSGSMAKQAKKMLDANKGSMQTQKQLIGEVGNQYFKEGQDGPMLYDPTSINKYKQDLLSGLDTRIDREATRAQADAHFNASHKLALANAARQNSHMAKMEKLQQDELGMQNAFQASIAPGKGKGGKVYPELKPVIAELDTVRKGLQKQAQVVVADFRNDYMTKTLGLEAKVVDGKWTVVPTKASPNKNSQAQVVSDMQAKLDAKIKSSYDPQSLNQYSFLQAKIKNPEASGMTWNGKYGDNGKPVDYVANTDAYMGRMLEWANPANASINPYQRKLALEYIANNKAAADSYRIKNLEDIRDVGRAPVKPPKEASDSEDN